MEDYWYRVLEFAGGLKELAVLSRVCCTFKDIIYKSKYCRHQTLHLRLYRSLDASDLDSMADYSLFMYIISHKPKLLHNVKELIFTVSESNTPLVNIFLRDIYFCPSIVELEVQMLNPSDLSMFRFTFLDLSLIPPSTETVVLRAGKGENVNSCVLEKIPASVKELVVEDQLCEISNNLKQRPQIISHLQNLRALTYVIMPKSLDLDIILDSVSSCLSASSCLSQLREISILLDPRDDEFLDDDFPILFESWIADVAKKLGFHLCCINADGKLDFSKIESKSSLVASC